MYEAIIKYLEENVLKQEAELPRREKDLAPHKAFMAGLSSLFVGNQDDFTVLNESLDAGELTSEASLTRCV